jgi:crotonobetainyl-CoA:carnitine CoA-transferase CaiB-like acyl-CoA transferase
MAMLQSVRVLDLTARQGMICAQILADLGADVVQVEPPGGAPGRTVGPFLGGDLDPEGSLSWWAYARGKRSIVLDIGAEQDRPTLMRLIETADVLVESEPVGRLEQLGLGDAALEALNPALIHVSMTGYGRTGPKAHWAWTDLTLMAAGGPLVMAGDEDRAPVRVGVPQAFAHAAAEAAAGVMVALHSRLHTGLGQRIDLAAQEAVMIATQSYALATAVGGQPIARSGPGVRVGVIQARFIWPAKDGMVCIAHLFGPTAGPPTRRLMDYVCEQGFCDAATRDKDWIEYGAMLLDGREPLSEFERVKDCIAACTASKTKAELLEAALERRLLVAPVSTMADLVNSPQVAARGYLVKPEGDGASAEVRYPGPFAKFTASPIGPSRRPPRIGEHGAAVLAELEGLEPAVARLARERSRDEDFDPARPLAGIRILDFAWVMAGPAASRYLANFGAQVVRVESTLRLDTIRTVGPFVNGDPAPENAAAFHNFNAGKKLITVDLTNEASRPVIHDLVGWADIVFESFSPRAMKAFGYDYESLRRIKPELLMVSSCLMGQTGPLANFAGYGNLAAAIAGFVELAGWPDRPAVGPFGAYTDYIAPRYTAAAMLAAIEHRRRTGQGQYVDIAQAEAGMHFLAPAILDYTANGRNFARCGNDDPDMAPHGVYPAAGEDRWVAIACQDEGRWPALCSVIDTLGPVAASHARLEARLADRRRLDGLVSAWTVRRAAHEIEALLQAAGIAASVVQTAEDLARDPQLDHLGHFIYRPHPCGRDGVIEACATRMSRTPARVDETLPSFGRDLEEILKDILGYDDERIADLLIADALV